MENQSTKKKKTLTNKQMIGKYFSKTEKTLFKTTKLETINRTAEMSAREQNAMRKGE